jgi:hypothetical protein
MKKRLGIFNFVIVSTTLFAAVIMAFSCKKEAAVSYVAEPVVQSYLVPGLPLSVYIKQEILIGSTDTATQTINGLNNVTITCVQTGIRYPLNFIGSGIYVDSAYKVVAGNTYNLSFTYNGTVVSASTVVPTKPTGMSISDTTLSIPPNTFDISSVTPLTLNWSNPNNDYFLVLVQLTNSADTLSPIDTASTSHFHRHSFFRNQPTQTNTSQVSPRDFSYYGEYYVILYKVNADYAELYNGSGNNSQNLTQPITDIKNGLGMFSGINADTIRISITN